MVRQMAKENANYIVLMYNNHTPNFWAEKSEKLYIFYTNNYSWLVGFVL